MPCERYKFREQLFLPVLDLGVEFLESDYCVHHDNLTRVGFSIQVQD